MDENVKMTVKNALTVVGALAVVKAAPVLAAGVAIGAAVSNTDKIKKAVNDFADRMEAEAARYREAANAADEEEPNYGWENEAEPVAEAPATEPESAPKKSREELINELIAKAGELLDL